MLSVEVSFAHLSGGAAFAACLALVLLFVLSLYAVDPGLPRNHPQTVQRRLLVIAVVCLLSPLYLWVWSDKPGSDSKPIHRVLGITCSGILPAIVVPLLLVLVLYSGPLVQSWLSGEPVFAHITHERADLNIRNYVFAPVSEEVVFRGCLVPLLLPQLGQTQTALLSPLFFGVAHLHHLVEWYRAAGSGSQRLSAVLVSLLAQVAYTSVFGMFSAYLFIHTGHLISPILSHALCNAFGLPDFTGIPDSPQPLLVGVAYVGGLLTFLLLLFCSPLLSAPLYTLCLPHDCTVVMVAAASFAVYVFYCMLRRNYNSFKR